MYERACTVLDRCLSNWQDRGHKINNTYNTRCRQCSTNAPCKPLINAPEPAWHMYNQRGTCTTKAAQIQLARHAMMCRLHVPVQIFLMEVGSSTQETFKCPDSSLLLVNWVFLAPPLMRQNRSEMCQLLATELA